MGTDLSLDDVEFLRTVRDINTNPSEFENTEGGEVPATTSAIRVASELDRSKVKYRAKPSDALSDLVVVHDADFDPETNSFGPKSVELTEEGVEAISEFDGRGGNSEAVKELQERVDRLENVDLDDDVNGSEIAAELQSIRGSIENVEAELERITDELAAVQSSEWGAIEEEKADKLDRVLEKVPVTLYLFDVLFDIEVDYLVEDGPYDDDELNAARRRIFELLSGASGDGLQAPSADGEPIESDAAGESADGTATATADDGSEQDAAAGQTGNEETVSADENSASTESLSLQEPDLDE